MSEPHITEKLPLWAGGDLSEQEMAAIHRHLESCPACKSEAKTYTEALSWLQIPSEHPFTAKERLDIRNKVMADIRKSNMSGHRRAMPWLLAAAASAAVIMLYNIYSAKAIPEPKVIAAVTRPDSAPVNQQAQQIISPQIAAEQPQPALEKAVYKPIKRRTNPSRAAVQLVNTDNKPSVTRIEFYLKEPNIRIIWFTKSNTQTTYPSGGSNEQPS